MAAWLETNRSLWDGWAAAHARGALYDLDAVVAGRDDLRPWEDEELGPVSGIDLVHLQCHIGTDTVAWARRGARVAGLDFSSVALAVARQLGQRCGLSIEWVQADVYDAVNVLGPARFDVVYTGIGALNWLPDVEQWARVAHDLLRPTGVLYLVEVHPMWIALIETGTTICQPAIGTRFQLEDDGRQGSYGAPEAVYEHTASYERLHTIADVLSALLAAGLRIELFHEFDTTPAPTPWLVPGDDGLYRFADGAHHFPVTYSVRARRP